MRSTHLHAVRHGRSGLESLEAGFPGGFRNDRAMAKGATRIRAAFAWLLLACVSSRTKWDSCRIQSWRLS